MPVQEWKLSPSRPHCASAKNLNRIVRLFSAPNALQVLPLRLGYLYVNREQKRSVKMDLALYADRIHAASHPVLVDALISLLKILNPLILDSSECTDDWKSSVRDCFNKLPAVVKTPVIAPKSKATAARKKKKAPPKKSGGSDHTAMLPARYALFWSPVSESRPSLADIHTRSASEYLSPFIKKAARLFEVEIPLLNEAFNITVSSAFDEEGLSPEESDVIASMTDTATVDRWFQRQKREVVIKKEVVQQNAQRRSLLGPGLAQRVSIMIHCLKKSLSPGASLHDLKAAVLHCKLGKDELTLLLETVPNPADYAAQRKVEEWNEAVKAVIEFASTSPDKPLFEDEQFVLFLTAVPQLHERLQCMYITAAFEDIIGVVLQKLSDMAQCLDMLVTQRQVMVLWQGLLKLGNMLNEGTSRGEQPYFKISALRRAIDVRGNQGMTMAEYLAGFAGGVLNSEEWRLLRKAAESGVFQTYSATKDVLDTYVTIIGGQSERGTTLPPLMTSEQELDDLRDLFAEKMREFAERRLHSARALVMALIIFMVKYAAAAVYFGDPDTLLPLESGLDGDSQNEESQARDLFNRLLYFIGAIRAKQGTTRVTEAPPEVMTKEFRPPSTSPPTSLQDILKSLPSPKMPSVTTSVPRSPSKCDDTPMPIAPQAVKAPPPMREAAKAPSLVSKAVSLMNPRNLFRSQSQKEKSSEGVLSDPPSDPPHTEDDSGVDEVVPRLQPPSSPEPCEPITEDPRLRQLGKLTDRVRVAPKTTRSFSSQMARSNTIGAKPKTTYYKQHRVNAPGLENQPPRSRFGSVPKLPTTLRGGNRLVEDQTTLRRIRQQLLEDKPNNPPRAPAKPTASRRIEPSFSRPTGLLQPTGPPAKRRARGSIEAVFEFARTNVATRPH